VQRRYIQNNECSNWTNRITFDPPFNARHIKISVNETKQIILADVEIYESVHDLEDGKRLGAFVIIFMCSTKVSDAFSVQKCVH